MRTKNVFSMFGNLALESFEYLKIICTNSVYRLIHYCLSVCIIYAKCDFVQLFRKIRLDQCTIILL